MRSGRNTLRPLLRCAAAGMLGLWVGAVMLCQVHCSCRGDDGSSGKTLATGDNVSSFHHQHKTAPASTNHHDDSLCLSLKSTALADNSFSLAHPAFVLVCILNSSVVAPDATIADLPAQFFRQSKHADWVFTPEVCLGPALHSLAPPILA